MVTTPPSPRRRARTIRVATALSAALTGGVVGSTLLTSASADVLAEPVTAAPVSEPQVVLVQRIERPVVIRAEGGSRLSAKGNDLVEISALGSFDVPEAALRAYKRAAGSTNDSHPGCDLPWTLLAGIGRVESDHGRYGGSVLGSDGVPRPAIRGVALNGVGPVAAIPDSDGGRFDGDTVWDRAVGPMQFIPTTWAGSGRDGDGDGVADPNDIDDAALAAAGYLCPSSGSIKAPGAMEQAIFSYNHSDYYVSLVMSFEQGYRTGTFTIPSPPPPPEDEETVEDETDEPRRERKERKDEKSSEPEKPSKDEPQDEPKDKPEDKPSQDRPPKPHHQHKPDRPGGGTGTGTGTTTPATDQALSGVLTVDGSTWKVDGQVVDFGTKVADTTYSSTLEALVGQTVSVKLKAGTVTVVELQGKPW